MARKSNKIWIWVALILVVLLLIFDYQTKESFEVNYTLPKRIWSYWDSDPPESILKIYKDRAELLQSWDVRLITNKTLPEYIDTSNFPSKYDSHIPPHKADYIRLRLLKEYGGIWMDASIIVHSKDAIDQFYNDAISKHLQFSAFTLPVPAPDDSLYTGDTEETYNRARYIENWFLLAPLRSPIIEALLEEFTDAIELGFDAYGEKLKEQDVEIISRINAFGTYLTQHKCIQKVLQKRHPTAPIQLYNAEENMFKLHYDCKWDTGCIRNRIQNDPSIKEIPFIKLRGSDR